MTPIPGTTRDVMELTLDIGGLPVIIADTAGLRKTEDIVENIGIERARQACVSAIVLVSSLQTDHFAACTMPIYLSAFYLSRTSSQLDLR